MITGIVGIIEIVSLSKEDIYIMNMAKEPYVWISWVLKNSETWKVTRKVRCFWKCLQREREAYE